MSQGIHPSIVASLPGHSTITVTLDVSSPVTPTMQRAEPAHCPRTAYHSRG
jgi:hypothetical protein